MPNNYVGAPSILFSKKANKSPRRRSGMIDQEHTHLPDKYSTAKTINVIVGIGGLLIRDVDFG